MKSFSAADVKYDIDNFRQNLSLEETEDTWEKIAASIKAFTKLCEDGAYDANPTEVVDTLRSSHRPIVSAMNSERTRLSLVALDFISALPTVMGKGFDQVLPLFLPPLLVLCGRTNKVVINRARSSIFAIIESTQLANVLSYFQHHVKDKSASLKVVIAEGTLACLNSCNPPDLEKESRAIEVEVIIRATARDANADVRKISRKIFESYKILLPSRVPNFTAPLSPTTKKYLDIKAPIISTQKTLNLRSTSTLKLEAKPSASTSGTKPAYSQTTSSTMSTRAGPSQARNPPAAMTRVVRKEPPNAVPISAVPARPTQPVRITSDPQSSTTAAQRKVGTTGGPMRSTATQEGNRPLPPVRSQPIFVSRGTTISTSTSGAPHRVQVKPTYPPAVSSMQTAASSGPRRVPVMAPPLPPIASKEKEGPKRPISRVDNAVSSSTHRSAVPLAPMKKIATSTFSSSSKDPLHVPNPSEQPKVKSFATVSGVGGSSASTNVKPLAVAKSKPLWGRSAPTTKPATATKPVPTAKSEAPPKPLPAASQRAPAKALIRKPSSRTLPVSKTALTSSKSRPITPAMVALPPSPALETVKIAQTEATPAPLDINEETKNEEEVDNDTVQTPEVVSRNISSASCDVIDEAEAVESAPAIVNAANLVSLDKESDATPIIDDNEDGSLPSDEGPLTPQGFLSLPSVNNAASTLASKTPISALLSSIERGFLYSPITPLSPADLYLPNGATPYSHQTHAVHLQGPRQPFNYALHSHGENGIFGGFGGVVRREEEMIRGDLGVVTLDDYNKLFNGTGMSTLDDGNRHAFLELNQ